MSEKIIIIIEGHNFDVTDFANKHPGGAFFFKKFNGKDATNEFNKIKGHSDGYVLGILDELLIGPVD